MRGTAKVDGAKPMLWSRAVAAGQSGSQSQYYSYAGIYARKVNRHAEVFGSGLAQIDTVVSKVTQVMEISHSQSFYDRHSNIPTPSSYSTAIRLHIYVLILLEADQHCKGPGTAERYIGSVRPRTCGP